MKPTLFACLLLVGCAKEPLSYYVSYTAECRMCAVEWRDDDVAHRDTIIGRFVYDGGVKVDTVQGTGKWNIMAEDGDALFIRVCSLRPDSSDGALSVGITGDVPDMAATGQGCTAIDVRASHQ